MAFPLFLRVVVESFQHFFWVHQGAQDENEPFLPDLANNICRESGKNELFHAFQEERVRLVSFLLDEGCVFVEFDEKMFSHIPDYCFEKDVRTN